MESYANYSFYENDYQGIKITSEEEFDKYSSRASLEVRKHILNKNTSDYEEAVSMVTCSIADILFDKDQIETRINSLVNGSGEIITSEKVGEYTKQISNVTYKDLKELISDKEINKKINDELNNYLMFTNLLNCGAYIGNINDN